MKPKKGLILINLGSPKSPSVKDVKTYLSEFLMDAKVIDVPYLFRFILVKGFIIPARVSNSAAAYKTVWTDRGSPLKTLTDDFRNLIGLQLDIPVAVCMRYGNPRPQEAIKELEKQLGGIDEVLLAPLYPHYAMSSYESALEYTIKGIRETHPNVKIKSLKPFYNEPNYINALADSIKPFIKDDVDAYLFSYHGLPVRHLKKSDATKNHCYITSDCCNVESDAWKTCYKHQVLATTKLVTKQLNLPDAKVKITFQSRLEGDKWIQPYTDKFFEDMPAKGTKNIVVACPAFVSDCLETLEEIRDRGKQQFMENGGETFAAVPCLNTNATWVNTFVGYCKNENGRFNHLWS